MMSLQSALTVLYCEIDEWWQRQLVTGRESFESQSRLYTSELLTLAIVAEWPGWRNKHDFWHYAHFHLWVAVPSLVLERRPRRHVESERIRTTLARLRSDDVADPTPVFHALEVVMPNGYRLRSDAWQASSDSVAESSATERFRWATDHSDGRSHSLAGSIAWADNLIRGGSHDNQESQQGETLQCPGVAQFGEAVETVQSAGTQAHPSSPTLPRPLDNEACAGRQFEQGLESSGVRPIGPRRTDWKLRGSSETSAAIHLYQLIAATRIHIGRAKVPSLACVFLLAIVLAESVTNLVSPLGGMLLHLLVFGTLIVQGAVETRNHGATLFLSLALVPLIRVVSLGIPLGVFSQEWWFVLTGIPILAASLTVVRSMGLSRHDVGLCLPSRTQWILTAVVAGSGLVIGYVEYLILGASSLSAQANAPGTALIAGSLLLGTGLTEEFVFRGILHTGATSALGLLPGILFTSVLFAVMHLGHGSMLHVGFIFTIALLFGYTRHWTGSLLAVVLAHTLANVVFFIALP